MSIGINLSQEENPLEKYARELRDKQKYEREMREKRKDTVKEEFFTPEAKAMRFNEGKLKWSYVDFKSLEPMVKVLMFGAKKYAPFNWQKGLDRVEILESMMRHLTALIEYENDVKNGKLPTGSINDPESGISHMGHIQCNAMFYNYMISQEK